MCSLLECADSLRRLSSVVEKVGTDGATAAARCARLEAARLVGVAAAMVASEAHV